MADLSVNEVRQLLDAAAPGPLLDARGYPKRTDTGECLSCGGGGLYANLGPRDRDHEHSCKAVEAQLQVEHARRALGAHAEALAHKVLAQGEELDRLRAVVSELEQALAFSCEQPSFSCDCTGCSLAREHHALMES